jgi:hypothetical protein
MAIGVLYAYLLYFSFSVSCLHNLPQESKYRSVCLTLFSAIHWNIVLISDDIPYYSLQRIKAGLQRKKPGS